MRHFIFCLLLTGLLAFSASAQNDWHTYPLRSMAEIVDQHSGKASEKADMLISANPFPSKTVAVYTGKHRPIGERSLFFIKLWAESRGVPQTSSMVTEEYLFREKDKEYWMPAVNKIAPFLNTELKEGDEVMIYYFFMGGYNAKTLEDKDTSRAKKTEGLPDRMEFVFVLEEFQKPRVVSTVKDQPLSAAIDKDFKIPAGTEFALDPRQVKSLSRLVYTGEVRATSEKRLALIDEWAKSVGGGAGVMRTLSREALFREGDKEYWIPVISSLLANMQEQLVKGDTILINTMLLGGVRGESGIEWVFGGGTFTKETGPVK